MKNDVKTKKEIIPSKYDTTKLPLNIYKYPYVRSKHTKLY
jgi:hypothetical protein